MTMRTKKELRNIRVPKISGKERTTVCQYERDMFVLNIFEQGALEYRLFVSPEQTARLNIINGKSRWSDCCVKDAIGFYDYQEARFTKDSPSRMRTEDFSCEDLEKAKRTLRMKNSASDLLLPLIVECEWKRLRKQTETEDRKARKIVGELNKKFSPEKRKLNRLLKESFGSGYFLSKREAMKQYRGTCSRCGHSFSYKVDNGAELVCPKCGEKLKFVNLAKTKKGRSIYYGTDVLYCRRVENTILYTSQRVTQLFKDGRIVNDVGRVNYYMYFDFDKKEYGKITVGDLYTICNPAKNWTMRKPNMFGYFTTPFVCDSGIAEEVFIGQYTENLYDYMKNYESFGDAQAVIANTALYAGSPGFRKMIDTGKLKWIESQNYYLDWRTLADKEYHQLLRVPKSYAGFLLQHDADRKECELASFLIKTGRKFGQKELEMVREQESDDILSCMKIIPFGIVKTLNYVNKLAVAMNESKTGAMRNYMDFLRGLEQDGYNLNDSRVVYPNVQDMVRLHQEQIERQLEIENRRRAEIEEGERLGAILQEELNIQFDKQIRERFKDLKAKYLYQSEKYVIFPSPSVQSLRREGMSLHICIGTAQYNYPKKYAKAESDLLYLRKKDKISEPFISLEIYNGMLIQAQGYSHSSPKGDVLKFLEEFCERRNIRRSA